MRLFSRLIPALLLFVSQVYGITHSGSVRAADQFIPGATITAKQGDQKIVAYTDENGRYTMDLPAGVWDIQVEVFGFTTVHKEINVSPGSYQDWTMEMPRLGEKEGDAAKPAATATTAGARPNGGGPRRIPQSPAGSRTWG